MFIPKGDKMKAIFDTIHENVVMGEILREDGTQVYKKPRYYQMCFYAYPHEVGDLMNKEKLKSLCGAVVDIIVSTKQSEEVKG